MCALTAGQRGRQRGTARAQRARRFEDRNLGRRTLQFHQPSGHTGELHLRQSTLLRLRSRALYPQDFIALVEKHEIPFHEKKLGQLFCDFSSRQIIEMLLAECAIAQVDVRCGCRVESVEKRESFSLGTNQGVLECDSLVIATGGLSFAKLGASDFGYRIAQQFGLKLTATRPGLFPSP